MDVIMPIMDGLTATKLIRNEHPMTPIIITTANQVKGGPQEQEYHDVGVTEIITKPFGKRVVADTLYALHLLQRKPTE